jgi:CotS family spore coat protein
LSNTLDKNKITINQSLLKYHLDRLPLKEYDFEVIEVQPVRAAYLLKTTKGAFALKKADYKANKLEFIHSAIEHLYNNGFKRLARTYLTRNGKTHIEVDGEIYFLTNWLQGREADLKSAKDMYNASQTLAELHLASKGFTPPPDCKPKVNLGKWPNKFQKRCNELLEFRDRVRESTSYGKFDRLFLSNVDYYYEQSLKAISMLARSSYLDLVKKAQEERGFCHRDYTYHNLIIDSFGVPHVIDFDYCVIDLQIADISRFFQKVMRKSQWEFDKVKGLLNSYEKINPLSPQDLEVLYISMMFPQKFWRLVRRYYDHTRNETELELFSKLKDITDERVLREDFLQRFSEFIY